jgi:hypothetical protein
MAHLEMRHILILAYLYNYPLLLCIIYVSILAVSKVYTTYTTRRKG